MKPRDLILTGVPRGGTTLCCDLLGRADDTVALVEPMPVHAFPLAHAEAMEEIRAFFRHSRASLLATGTATGQQIDGKGPDNFFDDQRDGSGLRVRKARLGDIRIDKPLSAGFTLVVKHNAAFTALLPALAQAFDCLALVRNPLSVLASWNSVELPVAQGRLPAGERLDGALAVALDAEPDRLERQLLLLDWLFARFAHALPRERILRYEDVVDSGGQALANASGVAVPLLPLASRNANRLYDAEACSRYAARLRAHAGEWRRFYEEVEILHALAQYLAAHPRIALPRGKEAHLFDAPDYDERWESTDIDARYAAHFESGAGGLLHGDATPIYCFHQTFVRRIAAYNPAMRWILLLRHPVERAVSQYHMERARGHESWPFWPAMLLEHRRLRGHEDDFTQGSPLRHFSYRARGDYARQLDVLLAHFPREQLLLLRNEMLAARPGEVLARTLEFLGLPAMLRDEADYARVFAGQYAPLSRIGFRFRLLQWLMRRPMRHARERYGLEWT